MRQYGNKGCKEQVVKNMSPEEKSKGVKPFLQLPKTDQQIKTVIPSEHSGKIRIATAEGRLTSEFLP